MKDNRFASSDATATVGVTGTASAAAPAYTLAVSEPAQPASAPAHDDGSVGVFQKALMLTVHNKTSQMIYVSMEENSRSVKKNLAPGETIRTAGHTYFSKDVTGFIDYADGKRVAFSGINPDFGSPRVAIGNNSHKFSVNETHDYTEDGHNFTVKRNADLDSGGKDFHIFAR